MQNRRAYRRAVARPGKTSTKPPVLSKSEPRPYPSSTLKRSAKVHEKIRKAKTGIVFLKASHNTVELLHESYCSMMYTYLLCKDAYSAAEVRNAKRQYHRVRRLFSHWEDVFGTSRVAQRFWVVISTALRLAKRAVKQPGPPLRGSRPIKRPDQDTPQVSQPNSFGIGNKVMTSALRQAPPDPMRIMFSGLW